MIRETVVEGEPALAVDTEEECDRALDSSVYVVPPSWANAMAWHPWDEKNTDSLEDFRYTSTIGESRPRPTRVVSHRQVRILSVGIVRASHDSCNNAADWFGADARMEVGCFSRTV